MLTLTTSRKTYVADAVLVDVAAVCRRVPPLWDLDNYVAVNPFLGFAEQPLLDAARTIGDGIGARVLPDLAFYRQRWSAGAFGPADLARAAARADQDIEALEAILTGAAPTPLRRSAPTLTLAERYDLRHGTDWSARLAAHAALWCAAFVPGGAAGWGQPAPGQRLYGAWREAALRDRSLEIAGLNEWRNWVAQLPTDPAAAIEALLDALAISPAERPGYLYRLLAPVFGWAAYLRREAWQAGDKDAGAVLDLLAIQICGDGAISLLDDGSAAPLADIVGAPVEDESLRMIFQEALEDAYARRTLAALNAPQLQSLARPAVQAVFCIDVRSEPLRRHLEAQSAAVETRGFAGFFGVSLEWHVDGLASARCPVLLQPGLPVPAQTTTPAWSVRTLLKKVATAPALAFHFVETLGLGYALGLAGDALGLRRSPTPDEGATPFSLAGTADATRVATAAGILKNLGLRERYGRLVLLCGHAGQSENNSHQAGLDCGACGGHGGAINARVAAAILNDPAVRAALPAHGFPVPADTHFLPGLHNTTTDAVELLDLGQVPASHRDDLNQLRAWLAAAGAGTRAERAAGLGISSANQGSRDRLVGQRARDWSEARPEWALARNAAFIAARRERSRGVTLDGRAFLHEYDWTTDPDNSILTLILIAPMVVASWINLQYFASTVDNERFGCGTKTLHNRVGSLGVILGNGGDLRTGLALQSVQAADGSWYHEPLRLQVIVEAPPERIEAVLAAHQNVRALVENGWVRLFALDPNGAGALHWLPGQGWERTALAA